MKNYKITARTNSRWPRLAWRPATSTNVSGSLETSRPHVPLTGPAQYVSTKAKAFCQVLPAALLAGMALLSTSHVFASVAPKSGCTLYVDGATGSNGNSGTAASPLRTPQGAEDWLEAVVAHHGSTYQVVAQDKKTYTYTHYPITTAQTVCITNSTIYDATNIPANFGNTPSSSYPASSFDAYTLEIKVSGTKAAPIVFTAYDPANPPVIRQTGYSAIQIDSTASWVTVSHLIVTGHAYEATQSQNLDSSGQPYALGRYKNTVSPSDWTFYDGDCIDVKGNPVDFTLMQFSAQAGVQVPYPLGVPTNIFIQNNQVHGCGGGGIGAGGGDYIYIQNNAIYDNAWWSLYGESAVSNRGVDSELYPTYTGPAASTTVKQTITGNYIFNNREYVPWRAAGKSGPTITDGEGVIIDTNRNGTTTVPIGNNQYATVSPYAGQTQIADNAIWLNGSSGLETFASQGVTMSNNTLYHNRYYPPILAGVDDHYTTFDPDGYPSPTATHSTVLFNPEIEVSEPTGTTQVVLNNVYGPTPVRTHGCTSTYTCLPMAGNAVPGQTAPFPYTYIGYSVLYDGSGVTIADPKNSFGTLPVSGDYYMTLNVDPLYGFGNPPPDQVFGQPYNPGSSNVFPGAIAGNLALDLRVLPGSPAYGNAGHPVSYQSNSDITGASQPNPTYELSGAWASPK